MWTVDWAQARALLEMAGWTLPLDRDVMDGLLAMQAGAEEALNRRE